jgi:hypothetical protein
LPKIGQTNDSTCSASRRYSVLSDKMMNDPIPPLQIEMPDLYKHSNLGYERFNKNFYLPNGTLKRKYSLPQLSDCMESVKNCEYLRRHNSSIDNNNNKKDDINNIFKDLNPDSTELLNFDILD